MSESERFNNERNRDFHSSQLFSEQLPVIIEHRPDRNGNTLPNLPLILNLDSKTQILASNNAPVARGLMYVNPLNSYSMKSNIPKPQRKQWWSSTVDKYAYMEDVKKQLRGIGSQNESYGISDKVYGKLLNPYDVKRTEASPEKKEAEQVSKINQPELLKEQSINSHTGYESNKPYDVMSEDSNEKVVYQPAIKMKHAKKFEFFEIPIEKPKKSNKKLNEFLKLEKHAHSDLEKDLSEIPKVETIRKTSIPQIKTESKIEQDVEKPIEQPTQKSIDKNGDDTKFEKTQRILETFENQSLKPDLSPITIEPNASIDISQKEVVFQPKRAKTPEINNMRHGRPKPILKESKQAIILPDTLPKVPPKIFMNLVLKFLKENNMESSVKTLEEESGVVLNNENHERMTSLFKLRNFDDSIRLVKSVMISEMSSKSIQSKGKASVKRLKSSKFDYNSLRRFR
jgi:hypothetical protein